MTPGHYLVLDIFFLMRYPDEVPFQVFFQMLQSAWILLQLHMYLMWTSLDFLNNCIWHGHVWTMWFWYSEAGEKKQSSWNFLFPHRLMAVLARGCINAVTRPMWSIVSQRTIIIGYVSSYISDGNAGPAQNNWRSSIAGITQTEFGILLSQRWNWLWQLDPKHNAEKRWADFPWTKNLNSGMSYKHMVRPLSPPVPSCHQTRGSLRSVTEREQR